MKTFSKNFNTDVVTRKMMIFINYFALYHILESNSILSKSYLTNTDTYDLKNFKLVYNEWKKNNDNRATVFSFIDSLVATNNNIDYQTLLRSFDIIGANDLYEYFRNKLILFGKISIRY